MRMTDHPDFEALSAYHDGEEPQWAAHVDDCEVCRSRLAELAGMSAAIAERPVRAGEAGPERPVRAGEAGPERPVRAGEAGPERPVRAGDAGPEREQAIAAALAAAQPTDAVRAGPAAGPPRLRRLRLIGAAAVAAAVLGLAGTTALLSGGGRAPTVADRALTESAPSSGDATAPAPGAEGPGAERPTGARNTVPGDIDAAVLGGELGEVGDPETLAAKVAPALRAAGVAGAPAPTSSPGPPEEGASRVVGTRLCEIEIREQVSDLGPVVYVGSATWQGAPLVVLGFGRRDGTAGVTLYAMARDGCRPLFSTRL